MKLRLLSDLHLESFAYEYKYCGEDVLVLAGDIHTRNRHHELIEAIPKELPILCVSGNHEFFHGEFDRVNTYLHGLEKDYPNFKYLQNERMIIGDVEFYGGTMFTDFSLGGESQRVMAEIVALQGIADFSYISKFDGTALRRWTVEDHKKEFEKFTKGLQEFILTTEGKKRVVISHFAPSPQTIGEQYKGSSLNPYFTVDMERFMGWPGVWCAGHTHSSCDIMVGDTRVLINPRGYGDENRKGFDNSLMFEI